MAKRYHESKRARHDEHMGMEKYERGSVKHHSSDAHMYDNFRKSGQEFYAGMEGRRRQEMEDAGYIHEDHSAVANLPQNVMYKPWEKAGSYLPEGLDDTIKGVNKQMGYDDSQRNKNLHPKKV